MITIFKGDDTGGALGKHIFLDIETQYDLTGCTVIFNYQGVERRFTEVHDGDRREVIFSHNETAKMAVGTFKAVVIAVDSSGKVRTLTNTLPIKVSTDLADSYDENIALVRIGKTISWANIGNLPFEGQEVDISTDDRVLAALGTIIEKLGGTVKASIALLALCAATAFGYTPEAHTNSYERDGVTYAQRGGMGAATYVVTNIADRAGDARVLPKYLHFIQTDSTYPEDAKWYYAQPRDYGHCSSVKDGDFLYRNFDMFLDDRAEFVVSVSGNGERFASVGVANCGTNLTERFVSTHKPSRYYKALAGSVVDGINENGVAININLVDGVPQWRNPNGDIHPLAAVRWTLDNAKDALDAATNLATRIRFPVGWTQNFHWMVCDAGNTYIVESGEWNEVTGRAVMTNFQRFPPVRGAGWERYRLLISSATSITNAWYTRAYAPDTDWSSEFKNAQEMGAIKTAWANLGTKEARRATGVFWQSVHTSVYDLRRKTLRIAVQEQDDWYVFAVPTGGRVKSVNGKDGEVVLDYADVGALPDDEELLKVDSDFRRAVEAVSPPFPEKIALASVTNSTGGAVQAADVNALPANDDYYQIYADDDFFAFDAWNAEGSGIGMYVDNDYASVYAVGSESEGAEYASDGIYYNNSTNSAQLAFPQDSGGTIATREWTQGRIPSLPAKWALSNVTNASGNAVTAGDVGAYTKYNSLGVNADGQVIVHEKSPWASDGITFECPVTFGTDYTPVFYRGLAVGGWSYTGKSFVNGNKIVTIPSKNGTIALTSDIPDGMPTTGLVWNATAGKVKTADGAKTIGAADVGAIHTDDKIHRIKDYQTEFYSIDDGVAAFGDFGMAALASKGLYVKNNPSGEAIIIDAMGVSVSKGSQWSIIDFPLGKSGTFAVDSWTSLRAMLADANINTNADCESISTNICKLIAPHIEPVKVLLNIYDNALEANWAFSIVNGDMKYACTTNEDITAFQKANPVLTDKQTADDYRVIVTGGEMKFFTDQN